MDLINASTKRPPAVAVMLPAAAVVLFFTA
jgi:hypothetical protein